MFRTSTVSSRTERARSSSANRALLSAEHLCERIVPAGVIAVGSGAGMAGIVRTYVDSDADGSYDKLAGEFQPFGGFTGGVRVAMGDFDGDGNDELVTGTGPGQRSTVKIWAVNPDGTVGKQLDTIFPFGTVTNGVYVAAGDLDGDGRDELAVSRQSDGSGVRIFSDTNKNGLLSDNQTDALHPFVRPFAGGSRVAFGDTNADGRAELIVGRGPGGPASVKVFADADGDRAVSDDPLVEKFQAFGTGYTRGVFVASSRLDDVGGNGAEVIVGRGSGAGTVKIFTDSNGDGKVGDTLAQTIQTGGTRGVRVAAGNTDRQGQSEVITSTDNQVTIQDSASAAEGKSASHSFVPLPAGYAGGAFVAFGDVNRSIFASLGGPISIPGVGTITTIINIPPGSGPLLDLDVDLELLCGLLGDQKVTLTHLPTGLSVTLFDGAGLLGGLFSNGLNIDLDDEAGIDILDGIPDILGGNITGLFNCPGSNALSVFDGIDPSGDWLLSIADNGLLNLLPGSLVGWALDILC